MPSLTRQRTIQSIFSDWSRNLLGATIDLHATSKPLILYRRQIWGFLKKNQVSPFSREILESYGGYLSFKYVSSSTKVAIAEELSKRAWVSKNDSLAVMDSNCLSHRTRR
ncbi:hypothetical protein C8R44DRAFT_749614 [Mycena epipterygia]|nr:hypothetical protein C8R44DRAFT_749614 [Mycena epipterygia]